MDTRNILIALKYICMALLQKIIIEWSEKNLQAQKHIKLEKLHDNLNIQIHREVKIIQN